MSKADDTLLHYRLVEQIGEGGMGVVWRAVDTTLDREVAIKVLPAEFAAAADRLSRFEREAKLLAALNHPNIATIHGLHADGAVHFLVMELIEGKPLSALIPAKGMRLQQLFDVAIPLTDALAAAHGRGITHRDLKPDNVMVTDDRRVKVLDFGLAKLASGAESGRSATTAIETVSVTQEGMIVGTASYMSPEQAEGKPVDARSDVFSLGIVLYEMAGGKRPFAGDTAISTISSILKDAPPSLIDSNAELPRHLDRVVRRCLSKEAGRRYPDAGEVRNELEELHREISSGERPAPATRAASQRPRWLLPVAGAALIVVLVFAALQLLPRSGAPEPPAPPPAAKSASAQHATSVAVLPFVDLSPEGDKEYFGDGIAEELINRLARVEGLRVAGRTSSFAFKGQDQDLRTIGESLGVERVIEGSVRSAGDQVRVTAQLIEVGDGFQLWSETYDRGLQDIFAVQDEIAASIVAALRSSLGGEQGLGEAQAEQLPTDDVEAYQRYLKARHLFRQRTQESLQLSIEGYERTLERDPDFARAWSGLAAVLYVAPSYEAADRDETFPRAREAAQRALELDPDNVEAHAVQGSLAEYELRWVEAEARFRRALELEPDDTTALLWHGGMLLAMGHIDEAGRKLQRAYEIDPASGVINGWVGHVRRARGDGEEALRWMREALRLDWGAGDTWVANVQYELQRDGETVAFVESSEDALSRLADEELIAMVDKRRRAFEDPAVRAELLRETAEGSLSALSLETCLSLDAFDEAFVLLDKLGTKGQGVSVNILARLWSPAAAELRRDPRFVAWAERKGLLDFWREYGWPDGCSPRGDGMRCG